MSRLTITPLPVVEDEDGILFEATVSEGRSTRTLWYRFPVSAKDLVSPNSNAFLVGLLFHAMALGYPIHVEGQVSPSLLESIDRFIQQKPNTSFFAKCSLWVKDALTRRRRRAKDRAMQRENEDA